MEEETLYIDLQSDPLPGQVPEAGTTPVYREYLMTPMPPRGLSPLPSEGGGSINIPSIKERAANNFSVRGWANDYSIYFNACPLTGACRGQTLMGGLSRSSMQRDGQYKCHRVLGKPQALVSLGVYPRCPIGRGELSL